MSKKKTKIEAPAEPKPKKEPKPKGRKEYVQLGRVQIGLAAVDSGQILICDPCYIESEWLREGYDDIRLHEIEYNGTKNVLDMGKMLRRGIDYNTPLKGYDNKSMNQLRAEGHVKDIQNPETGHFSYNGACRATQTPKGGGQLNFALGHAGAGVAVSAGYGDGFYPVFVHYSKDGRVAKVEIVFI